MEEIDEFDYHNEWLHVVQVTRVISSTLLKWLKEVLPGSVAIEIQQSMQAGISVFCFESTRSLLRIGLLAPNIA